jgi:hypothetical protein
MSNLARLWNRDSRRRPPAPRYDLELLEERTLLSGIGGSPAASHAKVSSITSLQSSLPTAVTGAMVTFAATVTDAANDAPIASGKVTFVVEAPREIVLGVDSVNMQGQASVSTNQLTKIAKYRVEAEYAPSNPRVSASASAPLTVKVIPQPLHVPTDITIEAGASTAETGQYVPLVATVKDAGTGNQVDAGKVEPITGIVQFYTDSPHPIILGEVALNPTKPSSSTILSAIESIFGESNQPATVVEKQRTAILTNKLKDVGPYPIEARFLPTNADFTASTSAPTTVTITPRTQNAPTVTTLQAPTTRVETGESLTFNATVQNAGSSSLAGGVLELTTVSPHPIVLDKVTVSAFDQPVSLTTNQLQTAGSYQIQAVYLPDTNLFSKSTSAPVTVTVTALTAASFRVTPVVPDGQPGEPMTFEVTALDPQGQPLTNYTGTVVITSPTDSRTNYPASVYASLKITEPPANAPRFAKITPQSYTFTPADHGSHIFVGAVIFGKAGAESIQVTQANDPKVSGKTTFAIG